MTRTWLQRFLQRSDTDLLSYDFADSCPAWESWWFRGSVAAGCICCFVWVLWMVMLYPSG
nr:hypothetical protein [uncultured Methanoregula sp.]